MVSEQEIRERIESLLREREALLDFSWPSSKDMTQAVREAVSITAMSKMLRWVLGELHVPVSQSERLRSVIQEFLVFENEMPIGDRSDEEMMDITEKMAEVLNA